MLERYYTWFVYTTSLILLGTFVYALVEIARANDNASANTWLVANVVQSIPMAALVYVHRNYEKIHPYARTRRPSKYHAISVYTYLAAGLVAVSLAFAILARLELISVLDVMTTYLSFFTLLGLILAWIVLFRALPLPVYQVIPHAHALSSSKTSLFN